MEHKLKVGDTVRLGNLKNLSLVIRSIGENNLCECYYFNTITGEYNFLKQVPLDCLKLN